MSASPGARRRGREAALQVLFAADAKGKLDLATVTTTFDEVLREFDLPPRARERALELARGVAGNCGAIDARIEQASANWSLYRLAGVDRNVIRIATYELCFEPAIPVEVVIDEAVEIARRFASQTSPAFVNGILDAVAKTRDV